MTLKELLYTVPFEDVWKELIHESKEYEAFHKTFCRLKELTPAPNPESFHLAVALIEDETAPDYNYYHIFGIKPGDKQRYSLDITPWFEWLSFNVVDKCIEIYGAADIVAYALLEMTLWGFDAAEAEANINKAINRLQKASDEFDNGTTTCVSWDDILEKSEFEDDCSQEELKQMYRITENNKRVYEMILSDESRTLNDLFKDYIENFKSEEWDTGKPVGNEIW